MIIVQLQYRKYRKLSMYLSKRVNNLTESQQSLKTQQPNTSSKQLNWIKQQLDLNVESEQTLHEKIIQLYQAIQNKTIKNIEAKKNNQILKAQIDAYSSIIGKIKKANEAKNKIIQNQLEIQSRDTQRKHESYRSSQSNPQSCQFSNQTFHQDQNNIRSSQNANCLSNDIQSEHGYQNKILLNKSATQSCLKTKKHKWQNNQCQDKFNKVEKVSCFDSNDENTQDIKVQIPQRWFGSGGLDGIKQTSSQNASALQSPRSSILGLSSKLGSPNKSFLKKSIQNASTANIRNKNISVNIQQLWNQSSSPKLPSKISSLLKPQSYKQISKKNQKQPKGRMR